MNTKKKISEIANITSGTYLQTAPDGDTAYLQVKDFTTDAPVKMASKVRMSKKVQNCLLRNNDILFAAKGAVYLAQCYNENDGNAVASTAFFVIRLKDNDILPEYLCWFLNQHRTEVYIKAQQQGTGVPAIRKGVVEQLEVPVPDQPTQRNIVALAQLAKKEYQLRKEIALKEQLLIEQQLMNLIK